MALSRAHEGYEYQDLLTAYFILNDLLAESNSGITIDTKEFDEDKIDDLTISTGSLIKKIQIKYSRDKGKHTLEKKDLATITGYKLAIDTLFTSWYKHPEKEKCKLRLCLTWHDPIDELLDVLVKDNTDRSFSNYATDVYKIDSDAIWPAGALPLDGWKRLLNVSAAYQRDEFVDFCDRLFIEVNLPKFSLDVYQPSDLEYIVLQQVSDLGIGVFPNENKSREEFILHLIQIIKQARSGLISNLDTAEIFRRLDIRQDYGAIYQDFPVVAEELVTTADFLSSLQAELNNSQRVVLVGEPGSGKSWFLKSLETFVSSAGMNVVHHLCYTDLNDTLQKDRIQTNVFYGNLIAEILQHYPELKITKSQKFASNLNELNHLLKQINKPTLLIVDGLDHIERVRNYYRYHDISKSQVEIILRLNDLVVNPVVSILVASQPIPELKEISNFKEVSLPAWSKAETLLLMNKKHLSNTAIGDIELVDLLTAKSKGNPLYTNYLIAECLRQTRLTAESFGQLPEYSYNLSNYYEYLFTNIKLNEQVPQILSGVSFALTKKEIIGITGLGDLVDDSIYVIAPVLKHNISQSGYKIYHESFKRFVFDKLKAKGVSIEKTIVKPIADWFEEKKVLEYPKAYRYFFSFLADYGINDRITPYANKDFIVNSLYFGQPWDLIKRNYYFLKDAVLLSKDLVGAVLINELSKVLSSTKNIFDEQLILYAEQLGNIMGYDLVSDYLLFEEEPTLPLLQGINICYLISEKGVTAPWTIYGQYFRANEPIKHDELHLYIRYLLCEKDEERLSAIANRVKLSDKKDKFITVFEKELANYPDQEYIAKIKLNSDVAALLKINVDEGPIAVNLKGLVDQLKQLDSVYDKYDFIDSFFEQIEFQKPGGKDLEALIESLRGINWFYNWIIYTLKIRLLKSSNDQTFSKVLSAFEYLTIDTEPFKGKPRSSDLHSIQGLILKSIKEGFCLLEEAPHWKAVINIVIKASGDTSVSIKKEQGGPIPTFHLFEIMESFANATNRSIIIEAMEAIFNERKIFDTHSYISDYLFRLSNLYTQAGDSVKADELFLEAIKTFTGYTERRDQTVEDLLDSLVSLSKVDYPGAIAYVPKIKTLIDAIDSHTDGKDTRHFLVEWFKKFCAINWLSSANYLLNDLKNARSNWRLEECLWNLLVVANGKINAEFELLLTTTFPIEADEKFVNYCLKLVEIVRHRNYELAYYGFVCLSERIAKRREHGYKPTLIKYYDAIALHFRLKPGFENITISKAKNYDSPPNTVKSFQESIKDRQDLDVITHSDLIAYVKEHVIGESEVQSFVYHFDSITELSEVDKELIRELVKKNHYYDTNLNYLEAIFSGTNKACVYYWVSRYIYERDGWYNQLVNIEAFKKASDIDAPQAKEYLFELLRDTMGISFRVGMSGNLINALTLSDEDPAMISAMYAEMFDAVDFRLPYKETEDWKDYIVDPLSMSNEELLGALLLVRLRSFSTERYQPTISAMQFLAKGEIAKMIKPLKWFFKNAEYFLDCIVASVMQLVYSAHLEETIEAGLLADEIEALYPTDYYYIDAMIEAIYRKPKRTFSVHNASLIYPAISQDHYTFLASLNKSVRVLAEMGLEIENVLNKYAATYADVNTSKLEIYGNRMYKQMAKNLYPSDYLMSLINKDLYAQLKIFVNQEDVLFEFEVENPLIQIQTLSRNFKPGLIPKTTTFNYGATQSEVLKKDGWVYVMEMLTT